MLIAFIVFLSAFIGVGLWSYRSSRGTKRDYYMASHSVPPSLVGLSAVATNNSGYMFIGVIGYTYSTGLGAIWLMIGWLLGDALASLTLYRKLHKASRDNQALSYGELLSRWQGSPLKGVQQAVAIFSLCFLLVYASAQLLAGSKALHVLLGWPSWAGACVGAVMVGLYCVAGGIRASIWTDAAQSVVMIAAMALLLLIGIQHFGGPGSTWQAMQEVPNFISLDAGTLPALGIFGPILFFIGWTLAGFSVAGQPHIMVRFMALNSPTNMRRARVWYYAWFVAFYCMATGVGLLARLYIPEVNEFDAELALPTMARDLLPGFFAGLILAGIFAATMSTADSLLLSCSSAFTHDLLPRFSSKTQHLKVATVLLTACALVLALFAPSNVFNLVIFAWSGLGSAFVPLLIAYCLGLRITSASAICAMIAGFGAALLWRLADLHGAIYEGVAGLCIGLFVLFAWHFWLRKSVSPSTPLS